MPGLLEEPSPPQTDQQAFSTATQKLPKGVVLDKDGKPCRTCTSSAAWLSMMKSSTKRTTQPTSPTSTATPATTTAGLLTLPIEQSDCPPDVDQLGRSTWTLLHALTATYPEQPTAKDKSNVSQFLRLFGQLYPCWVCAEDFRAWMGTPGNEPRLSDAEEFGRWMCAAHNAVNVKLGKGVFDCALWRERWRDGWRDGRCG